MSFVDLILDSISIPGVNYSLLLILAVLMSVLKIHNPLTRQKSME